MRTLTMILRDNSNGQVVEVKRVFDMKELMKRISAYHGVGIQIGQMMDSMDKKLREDKEKA